MPNACIGIDGCPAAWHMAVGVGLTRLGAPPLHLWCRTCGRSKTGTSGTSPSLLPTTRCVVQLRLGMALGRPPGGQGGRAGGWAGGLADGQAGSTLPSWTCGDPRSTPPLPPSARPHSPEVSTQTAAPATSSCHSPPCPCPPAALCSPTGTRHASCEAGTWGRGRGRWCWRWRSGGACMAVGLRWCLSCGRGHACQRMPRHSCPAWGAECMPSWW